MTMASNPTDLSVRHSGAITIIEFLDRRLIDAVQIERIGERILELVNSAAIPKVVLDFNKVEYLSSTALNVLIRVENAIDLKKGELRLSSLDPDLRKVFTLMKLDKVMKICKDTDEAVTSIKA